MVDENDLTEIIFDELSNRNAGEKDYRADLNRISEKKGKRGFYLSEPYLKPYTSLPARKIFLSEYDVKKLMRTGQKQSDILRIPRTAIVSPLAQEWLDERRIRIVRD